MNLFALLQTNSPELNEETSYSWLPPQYSTTADIVDPPFWFIFWVCVFFFVLIVGLMGYFVVKYRRRDESEPPGVGSTHNTPLEITWTVIPLILAFFMFWWGLDGYVAQATPPSNCYKITVTAQKWNFSFGYPDGLEHNELHVWAGQPFAVEMRSQDVLHALSIPVFRTKMDIVPGRYSTTWFEPTVESIGTHRVYCAEYCGKDHSAMKTIVVVHPTRKDFEEWIKKAGVRPDDMLPAEWGRQLTQRKGCLSCHNAETEDEEGYQGPSWVSTAKLYHADGKREFSDGTSMTVNMEYLDESIRAPAVRIVKGYELGKMPQNRLSPDDREAVIEYIKLLAPSN